MKKHDTIISNAPDTHRALVCGGALFPLAGLPAAMVYVTRIDPLSYGVDALRGLLINASQYSIWLDVGALFLITTLFLGLGSYFFSKIEA